MQERQPLVNVVSSNDNINNHCVAAPSLLIRQFTYVNRSRKFANSRVDFHTNAIAIQLPENFERETLIRMDDLLTKHSAWFLPFYLISLILAFVLSLVGSALPTFVASLYILFIDLERRRMLKQNLQTIVDQQNETYFKRMGLLLVLNPSGLVGAHDLAGSWQLNIVSHVNFIDNGLANMKIYEIVATEDSKYHLFNGELLPGCIQTRFGISQDEFFQTTEEINGILKSENDFEQAWITRPLYWYLFACSLLLNLPILVTFPLPIVYYLIVKFFKFNKLNKSNQVLIDKLIQDHNERVYIPKGLRLDLVKQQETSMSKVERLLQISQLQE